jgi:hypothetical protein
MCAQGLPRNLGGLVVSVNNNGAGLAVIQPRSPGGCVPLSRRERTRGRTTVLAGESEMKPVEKDGEESELPATYDEGEPTRRDPSEG